MTKLSRFRATGDRFFIIFATSAFPLDETKSKKWKRICEKRARFEPIFPLIGRDSTIRQIEKAGR